MAVVSCYNKQVQEPVPVRTWTMDAISDDGRLELIQRSFQLLSFLLMTGREIVLNESCVA